jgi:hypothetical protein
MALIIALGTFGMVAILRAAIGALGALLTGKVALAGRTLLLIFVVGAISLGASVALAVRERRRIERATDRGG